MSSSSSSSKKKVTLMSGDGPIFEVEEAVAAQSGAIKLIIDEGYADGEIFGLPRVCSQILSLVIKYCTKHSEVAAAAAIDEETKSAAKDTLEAWDADFMNIVEKDKDTLFNLTKAANLLNIESLLNLTCKTMANSIEGKTADQIRSAFNVKNLTPSEEDEKIRKEIGWAFE